jgi:hypothetical protein
MSRTLSVLTPVALVLALAAPSALRAQDNREAPGHDIGGGGNTAPAPAPAPAPPPSPAPSADSGGSGSATSSGGSGGASSSGGSSTIDAQPGARAVPRSGASRTGSGRSGGGGQARPRSGSASGNRGDAPTTVPPYSRPREGRSSTGEAVERRPGEGGIGNPPIVIDGGGYYGGFYPWGWGGLGFGGYYGSFYDPWWYDPYPSNYSYGYEGSLRIKVKPKSASVYVDGYFAGNVDDYDGTFQKLRIDSGPHRIELREDGYEPLQFEVRIQPDRTVTYKGEMKKVP